MARLSLSDLTGSVAQHLTRRYVAALSLVALLSVSGQVLVQWMLHQQETHARVINLAGRQRMLSQRVGQAALQAYHTRTPETRRTQADTLSSTLSLLIDTQQDLRYGAPDNGLPPTSSDTILVMFGQIEPTVGDMRQAGADLLAYLQATPPGADTTQAGAQARRDLDALVEATTRFLPAMNTIVFAYDREATALVQRLQRLEALLLSLVLLVLLLEALLVFRPATARVRAALDALRHAKQEALAASEAKALFLANMSHEIRTPMNGVLGTTDLLATTDLSGEQCEYVDIIQSSGTSLLGIINDILDFSKIDSGMLELEEHPFDLYACMGETASLFAGQAAEKRLELALDLQPGTPQYVVGDAMRIRQILSNLVSNALKFTEAGEVVIRIAAKATQDDRWELTLSVEDTGIGIPEDRQDQLFASFQQADRTTTRKYGGTGLGLAISKQLAELMEGSIDVESAEGQGSCFTVTVYLNAAPHAVPAAPDAALFDDHTILVVDDNATNRLILESLLARWGAEPVLASSGAEALDLIRTGPPFSAALLDWHMPGMDGVDVARAIRREPRGADVPLVLLSSVSPGERYASLFAARLLKPTRPDFLWRTIGTLVLSDYSDPLDDITPPEPAPASPTSAAEASPASAAEETLASTSEKTPASTPPAISDSPSAAPSNASSGTASMLRLLVVEDNPINQKVMARILAQRGYEADIADNGAEALAAVENASYDVILMDVQMPVMDGLKATRRLRERYGNDGPYIVAVTANAQPENATRCFAAGMDAFVPKPVDRAKLFEVLERVAAEQQHLAT